MFIQIFKSEQIIQLQYINNNIYVPFTFGRKYRKALSYNNHICIQTWEGYSVLPMLYISSSKPSLITVFYYQRSILYVTDKMISMILVSIFSICSLSSSNGICRNVYIWTELMPQSSNAGPKIWSPEK